MSETKQTPGPWESAQDLIRLCGDFRFGDGFFILKYADSADHGESEDCTCGPIVEDANENDISKWSAHFHIGLRGEGNYPSHWENGSMFCARGATAEAALSAAIAKADGKGSER